MLFNEPKLLKSLFAQRFRQFAAGFSALQRAEIAEIQPLLRYFNAAASGFSALQRAEIAEMLTLGAFTGLTANVSVLFNEPKLLK